MSSTHSFALLDGTVGHGEPPGNEGIWERVHLATGLSENALRRVVTELRRHYSEQEIRRLPPWEIEAAAEDLDL